MGGVSLEGILPLFSGFCWACCMEHGKLAFPYFQGTPMGSMIDYSCPKCHFRYSGGERIDSLMQGMTYIFQCLDCPTLFDAFLSWSDRNQLGLEDDDDDDPDDAFETVPPEVVAAIPTPCPHGDNHETQPWSAAQPCPGCGHALEATVVGHCD